MSTDKLAGDIQRLEPGERIELFELDMQPVIGAGSDNILWFHGYTQVGSIYWQGNEYKPWPIQAEGFQLNPQKPPQPTLSAGNVKGSITALCLAYQDLVGAKLTRHRTLGKYLDVANFPEQSLGEIVANKTSFGTPGSAIQQLQDDQGRLVKDATITAIHQTDWQGRVELSDQARTNYAPYSGDLSQWSAQNSSLSGNASLAPDGTMSMCRITADGGNRAFADSATTITAGTQILESCFVRRDQARYAILAGFGNGGGGVGFDLQEGTYQLNASWDTAGIRLLNDTYALIWGTCVPAANGQAYVGIGSSIGGGSNPDAGEMLDVWGAMVIPGVTEPGIYIPTADSPVTVTDYTASDDGQITLGQKLAGGGTLDWSGTGTAYDPGGNPDADATQEFAPDIWFIEQKLSETPEIVQFALSSALDFGQVQLPRRRILAKDFPAAGLTR